MKVLLSPYQMLINSVERKSVTLISEQEKQSLESSLDYLSKILGNSFQWVVSGGLAIPLTSGNFYRKHNDIDIGISQEDFEKFIDQISKHNYSLFLRPFMSKISSEKKLDIYKKVSIEEALNSQETRMRVLRTDYQGRINFRGQLLDYLDLYLHRVEGNKLISGRDGITVDLENSVGPGYKTLSGNIIFPRDLEYIKLLKSRSKKEVDILDLKKITEIKK